MSYYVSKINRVKWNVAEKLKDEEDINKLTELTIDISGEKA